MRPYCAEPLPHRETAIAAPITGANPDPTVPERHIVRHRPVFIDLGPKTSRHVFVYKRWCHTAEYMNYVGKVRLVPIEVVGDQSNGSRHCPPPKDRERDGANKRTNDDDKTGHPESQTPAAIQQLSPLAHISGVKTGVRLGRREPFEPCVTLFLEQRIEREQTGESIRGEHNQHEKKRCTHGEQST